MAAHTGIEPNLRTSQLRVISAEVCDNQRVKRKSLNRQNCKAAQIYAVFVSEFVRKFLSPGYGGRRLFFRGAAFSD
jgi:hypothetical protein